MTKKCNAIPASCALLATIAMVLWLFAGVASATEIADHAFFEASGRATPAPAKYQYMFTPGARWNGTMHWKYNHANAPVALAANKADVIAQLQRSFAKWTAQCGVTQQYDGETTVPPNKVIADPTYGNQPDGTNVVGWGALDPSLGGWTYDWWLQSGSQRFLVDADVTLSVANVTSIESLDRLVTHEWGHALGLDHSNVDEAIMAGPPSTSYSNLATPQADDLRGCRCQYGLPAGVSAGYACAVPASLDFAPVAIGANSAAQSVTFTNSGNAPLSIQATTITNAQFSVVAGCQAGATVAPGASCTLQVQSAPATTGSIAGQLKVFTNDGEYRIALQGSGVQGAAPPVSAPATVDVVEFYNASLDHYFITWLGAEIANLDAGNTPTRWTRTGRTFKAYAAAQTGVSQVCRVYIPPTEGDSHFFGRGSTECNASRQAHPEFVLEDPSYMGIAMPTMGTCPSGTQPMYRVFNNRADTNHRYVTDRNLRDQMVAIGWTAEGDGADRVAMCIPG